MVLSITDDDFIDDVIGDVIDDVVWSRNEIQEPSLYTTDAYGGRPVMKMALGWGGSLKGCAHYAQIRAHPRPSVVIELS